MKQYSFEDQHEFLAKLEELLKSGVPPQRIQVITPFPVHKAMHLLKTPPSRLKYFTFTGAFTGLIAGFILTIGTVLSWPIITGGKPLVSTPAFLIIAFELTILLGAIASLLGFLHLNRLPSVPKIIKSEETGNHYVIRMEE